MLHLAESEKKKIHLKEATRPELTIDLMAEKICILSSRKINKSTLYLGCIRLMESFLT